LVRRISPSQFKSQMRQQINKVNQAVNNYDRAVNNYNRQVKQAVNEYNQAVRQHNAKVQHNRSHIQAELRRLNSSSSIRTVTTYRTSVSTVHSAYQRVADKYDTMEYGTPFQEYVYSGIEQENANNLAASNVVLDNSEPSESEYSLQDTQIMDRLSTISTDLDNRWKGALFSLSPQNPDATRHFCTSAREIFTEIFDSKATDKDVFAVMPNCEKTERGNASRRSKIIYFLQKKGIDDSNVEIFVNSDIDNILELFHILSTGTHGTAGRYTYNQLAAIKKRVEDGLIFLCDIAA
jgi:hypothetical protein